MRNLTIKRTKSFVACLMTLKVYIEDPTVCEVTINNVPCRRLGTLKNGEEKTFVIGEEAARVFVIIDQLSRNYCNECYQLPEGCEDVYLSGKNKFNLAGGNAFLFDNNDSEDVMTSRKRNNKKGLLVLIAALIVGVIVGIAPYLPTLLASDSAPKSFSAEGMTITLTNEFKASDIEQFTAVYDSQNVVVFALKEEFTLLSGLSNYTLDEYHALVLEANGLGEEFATRDNELLGFVYDYTDPEANISYRYFSYVYKAPDAFWVIQFVTLVEDAEQYRDNISEWARSVSFSPAK